MKKVQVTIVGTAPLMMNKRPMEEAETIKKKGEAIDPETDARKKSHFDETLGYYVPSDMIEAVMREGGKGIKKGRGSFSKTVMSCVRVGDVPDEKLPLGRKDYDVLDKRFGTHPSTGNGILISRVRFNNWKLEFPVHFDETQIDLKTLRFILDEAGSMKGIGSYLPKFGRFKVEKFEEA